MGEGPFAVTAPHAPVDALLTELHASRGGLTADEARRRFGEVGERSRSTERVITITRTE
jgi:hypothetical protein